MVSDQTRRAAKFGSRMSFMVKSFQIGREAFTEGFRSYPYGWVTRYNTEVRYDDEIEWFLFDARISSGIPA